MFPRLDNGDNLTWTLPQDDSPQIFNGRWEHNDSSSAGRAGKKAPTLKAICIMGAWQDKEGHEYVHPLKISRANQISTKGRVNIVRFPSLRNSTGRNQFHCPVG